VATATINIERSPFAAEIEDRLSVLGATQRFLSDYLQISQGELSKILGGYRPTDSTRMNQINSAVSELEELQKMFSGVQLGFRDAESTKELVRQFAIAPAAKKEIADSLATFRAGLDALSGK
jgi:hypothetical protein